MKKIKNIFCTTAAESTSNRKKVVEIVFTVPKNQQILVFPKFLSDIYLVVKPGQKKIIFGIFWRCLGEILYGAESPSRDANFLGVSNFFFYPSQCERFEKRGGGSLRAVCCQFCPLKIPREILVEFQMPKRKSGQISGFQWSSVP